MYQEPFTDEEIEAFFELLGVSTQEERDKFNKWQRVEEPEDNNGH